MRTAPCCRACASGLRQHHACGGIRFVHNTRAFGKKYLPETMGPGCGFIDYDNDGWLDILLTTNGGPAYLFCNPGGNPNNALPIKTGGTRSNKNGIGAIVRLVRPTAQAGRGCARVRAIVPRASWS